MPAHHYPFIELAVHAAVRDHFAKGDAVAVLSRDLGEVLWANGAAAHLLGFSNIYDALDEGFGSQPATRRQIESAVSGLGRTGKPQNFMMRVNSGFSRAMAPATLDAFTLPDGASALLLTSSQVGQVLAPGARPARSSPDLRAQEPTWQCSTRTATCWRHPARSVTSASPPPISTGWLLM